MLPSDSSPAIASRPPTATTRTVLAPMSTIRTGRKTASMRASGRLRSWYSALVSSMRAAHVSSCAYALTTRMPHSASWTRLVRLEYDFWRSSVRTWMRRLT